MFSNTRTSQLSQHTLTHDLELSWLRERKPLLYTILHSLCTGLSVDTENEKGTKQKCKMLQETTMSFAV